MADDDAGGRLFREAWIAGVKKYLSDNPKPSYIVAWDGMAAWEKSAASTVFYQVKTFLEVTDGAAAKLDRQQKGRFVALCWTGQVWRHFEDPKPAYVADWDELPGWQQDTDADIFEWIARKVGAELPSAGR
jgi:hypothetical protein